MSEWGTNQQKEMVVEGNREGLQVVVSWNQLIVALNGWFCTSLPEDMFNDTHW